MGNVYEVKGEKGDHTEYQSGHCINLESLVSSGLSVACWAVLVGPWGSSASGTLRFSCMPFWFQGEVEYRGAASSWQSARDPVTSFEREGVCIR
jgi:hypothetical protein